MLKEAPGTHSVTPSSITPTRLTPAEAHRPNDPRAAWRKYCGFLDLSPKDFSDVQEQLLMEQLSLVHGSPLGRHIMRGARPTSVAEFRERVPLTTYGDYAPYLIPGRDDALGAGALEWAHTAGIQGGFKWIPYTQRGLERFLDGIMAAFILAGASKRGDVKLRAGGTVLFNAPARPYVSGLASVGMVERFGLRGIPDPVETEHLDFGEKVRIGFKQALGEQVDVITSMTSVLVKVGAEMSEHASSTKLDRSMFRPRAFFRLAKALLKSKLLQRPILPKDLWPTKAILGWGADTPFFRDQVNYYWGKVPFSLYICTEGGIMGMETWERNGMVFNPYGDFYEFIPEEETRRSREDARYQPRTVLLDEVEPDKTYEVVITNFYGMAFLRYRVGHFVKFMPSRQAGQFPRFDFVGRADESIDLAGFTRLDEKSVWDALARSGVFVNEWTIRKEYNSNVPELHLYLEVIGTPPPDLAQLLHAKLKEVDHFYADLESVLGIRPMRVKLLPRGTFERFYQARREQGAELGRRRPPHMNPSDEDIRELVGAAREEVAVWR